MSHPEKLTADWVGSWEKLLAQNLPFKIFLKGRDLTYLACNENYAVDHGMKPSEIFGRSDYDLYPRELAEKYRVDDLRILETGRSETIEECYVKDGQEFHVQTIKSLFRDQSDEVIGILGTFWDVSELKRAEEALKKSTQLLSDTGEMAQVGGWELDLSTQEVSWTEEVCRIHGVEPGYRPKLEEALNFYAPESRPAVKEALEKAAETGEPYDLESLFIPSGSKERIWVRLLGRAVTSDGKITKLAGTFQNIDKYKRVEEALRESESRYRELFEAESDAIVLIDNATGNILEANSAVAALYGYNRAELLTKRNTDLSAEPEETQRVTHEMPIISDQVVTIPLRFHRKKDGTVFPVEITGRFFIREGRPVHIAAIRDITERKRAEEELRTSQRRLEMALIGGGLGTYEHNLQTREIQVDARYLAMLGYAPGELDLANMDLWEQLVHPEDLAQTRSSHTEVEFRMRHKDGHWIWVLDTGRVVEHDSLGRPLRMSGVHQDISERKRAEEALLEERNLFVSGPTVVFRWQPGLPWLVKYASPNVQELLGYPPEAFTSGSLSYADVIHPDDIDRLAQEQSNYDRQGRIHYEQEYRLQRSDGQILWVHDSTRTVIVNGSRQDSGYVTDITERKRAEEALRESESFNRGLVENVPDYIAIYGSDGKILHVNPASATVLGYSAEELVGTPVLSYVADEYRHEVVSRITERQEVGEVPPYEIDLLTHGGLRRSVIVKGTQIQYRDIPATLLVLTDITERKRAEEALRESEERYRTLFDEALDGICLADAETGLIIDCNQALAAFVGRERAELIGQPQRILHPINTDQEVFSPTFRQHLTDKEGQILETQVVTRTGIIREVEIKANLLNLQGRKMLQGVFRDITDRKQIEGEMEKTRADFLFGVSHELKTPLFLMDISLEMLENSPESGRAKRTSEFMETWKRNLHRLEHLVFNMVDSQRTQTMGFKVERQSVDCRALIERVVQEQELLAGPKKVRITLDLAPMPPLFIDLDAIHRLVENLLTNAIKFSPRSGEVTIRLTEEDAQAVLTVKDQGPGISAEEQKGLFLPFQRAATAVRSVIPGTGLGLYVAKIIVDAHGGTISLQSKVGRGTTVTVRLPLGVPEDEK